MRFLCCAFLCCTFLLCSAFVAMSQAETPPALRLPAIVSAGEAVAVSSSGTGSATFYLIGPGSVAKRQFQAGDTIQISSEEIATAGNYQVMACNGEDCSTTNFYVTPNRGAELVFLVHPSRVPVGRVDAISAVTVVMDGFHNLALQPESVTFRAIACAIPKETVVSSPPRMTRNGIAWTRLNSGAKDGAVVIDASLGQLSERRVVQQLAAEPCKLHASAEHKGDRVVLQTEPVRDCRGNSVPDGTIVTFTKLDKLGRSTVDAPIKKGVARTDMGFAGPATISVASGVVAGNEIYLGGSR
jgi:hypothetical protein